MRWWWQQRSNDGHTVLNGRVVSSARPASSLFRNGPQPLQRTVAIASSYAARVSAVAAVAPHSYREAHTGKACSVNGFDFGENKGASVFFPSRGVSATKI